jgi:hypothetical protein
MTQREISLTQLTATRVSGAGAHSLDARMNRDDASAVMT